MVDSTLTRRGLGSLLALVAGAACIAIGTGSAGAAPPPVPVTTPATPIPTSSSASPSASASTSAPAPVPSGSASASCGTADKVTVTFSGTGFPAGRADAKVYLDGSSTALKSSHPTVLNNGTLDVTFSTFKAPSGVTAGTVQVTPVAQAFPAVTASFSIPCASSPTSTGPAFPVQATTSGTGTPWFEQPGVLVLLGVLLLIGAGVLGRGNLRVARRRNH